MSHKIQIFIFILLLLLLQVVQVQADQTFNLRQGFNFAAITSTTTITADEILNTNPFVQQIFIFDPTSQQFRFKLRTSIGLFGEIPAFIPGQGVIFNTTASGTVNIPGTYVDTTATKATLVTGFNFLGFCPITRSPLAYGVLATYTGVKSIFRWDHSLQGFRFVIRLDDRENFGTDFVLEPDAGYFISATTDNFVDFGNAILTGTGNEILTVTFEAPVAAAAPALAVTPAALPITTANLLLTSTDGQTVYYPDSLPVQEPNVILDTKTTPGSYMFKGVPLSIPLKIMARSTTGNIYRAAFIGTLNGNAIRVVNDLSTTLSLIYEKDQSTLAAIITKTPSELAESEGQLAAQLKSVLETVQKTLTTQSGLLADDISITTVAALHAEMLNRVEVSSAMVQQILKNTQVLFTKMTAEQYYAQALALLASQGSQENVEYLKQALNLLGSITGTDLYTTSQLTEQDQENIRLASAMACNSLGDLAAKTGSLATSSPAPGLSFMAAYRSLAADIGDPATEGDAAYYYSQGWDHCRQLLIEQPAKKADPDILTIQLRAATPLAAVDPLYMEEARVKADALKAKLDQAAEHKMQIGNGLLTIDSVDVLQLKGDALIKGGNPAGAVEVFDQIEDAVKDSQDTEIKAKARRVRNYGMGKARIEMGAFADAFDSLKTTLTEFAGQSEVTDTDVEKFSNLNEALLAMSAVIEKLQIENPDKLIGETRFSNPADVARKIQKKSDLYIQVVHVVINQGQSGSAEFGDHLLQSVFSSAQLELNRVMSLMSDYHFLFQIQKYSDAEARLTTARGSVEVILTTLTSAADESNNAEIKRIRGHALLQKALTYFYQFRLSLLQRQKNDDLRTEALKAFYTVKERYPFLIREVADRIVELERFGRVVDVIANRTFEIALQRLKEAESLIQAEDFTTADQILANLVTTFKGLYTGADSTETSLKKEALVGFARSQFHRYIARAHALGSEAADQEKVAATAALKYLKAQYPDLRDLVLELLARISSAGMLVGAETANATGLQAVSEAGLNLYPAIYQRAVFFKSQADFLYSIGDATGGASAFNKSIYLFDQLIVDNVAELIPVLTDQQVAAIQSEVGTVIENRIAAGDPRLSEPEGKLPFWKMLASSAMKDKAMLYAERYWNLGDEVDRQKALDLLNRIFVKFPDVPTVAEVRDLLVEINGDETADAAAPVIGNVAMTPQSFIQGAASVVNVSADVLDPQGIQISRVVLSVIFAGELLGQYALANIPLPDNALSSLACLPVVSRAGAPPQSPRWSVDLPLSSTAEPGIYDLVLQVFNTAETVSESRAAFIIKPNQQAAYRTLDDLYIDFTRNRLVAGVSGTLLTGDKVTVTVLQHPPQGVANPLPVPVDGYAMIPISKVAAEGSLSIFEVPLEMVFDSNFKLYGDFELLVKLLDVDGKIRGSRSLPWFRKKVINLTTDPVITRFKQWLGVFNWSEGEDRSRKLATLKRFSAFQFTPTTLSLFYEELYSRIFQNISASSLTILSLADLSEDIHLEYKSPDSAVVRARVRRVQKYGRAIDGIIDPFGKPLLPPGKSGFVYTRDEVIEQRFQLINNQWYAIFTDGGQAVASNLSQVPARIKQVYINPQNVLEIILDKPVDLLTREVVVSVFQAPQPDKGIFTARAVEGFRNLKATPTGTSTSADFRIPLGNLVPATFPVHGQLQFRVKLRKLVTPEELVSDFYLSFFRSIPVSVAERSAAFNRYLELKAAIEGLAGNVTAGDITTAISPYTLYNFVKNQVDPGVVTFLVDALSGAAAVQITPPTPDGLKVEVIASDQLVLHFTEKWNIAYSLPRTSDLMIPVVNGGSGPYVGIKKGLNSGEFYFPRSLTFRNLNGEWFWARVLKNADLSGVQEIVEMYLGPNNDLIVQTTMDNSDHLVKLFLMKKRADGTMEQVGGFKVKELVYDTTAVNTWKIPLNQVISAGVLEYGEMILQVRLYEKTQSDMAAYLVRRDMSYFRQYQAGRNESLYEVARKYTAWLSGNKLDGSILTFADLNEQINQIKTLWISGQTVGIMPGDVEQSLRSLCNGVKELRVTLDTASLVVDYAQPDFAFLRGMIHITGTHAADHFKGIQGVDGMLLVPPGPANAAVNSYAPFESAMKVKDNIWYLTGDDPFAPLPPTGNEPWIVEAFLNDSARLVVVTNEPATSTFKVRISVMQPPASGEAIMQPNPVPGYQEIDVAKIAETDQSGRKIRRYEIDRDRIFSSAFPVYGALEFQVRIRDNLNNERFMMPVPFFRPYENEMVQNPVRDRFMAYLNAVQTLNAEQIKGFWSTDFQIGRMPPHISELWSRVNDSVKTFDINLTGVQIEVEAIAPDRVRVHAFVPLSYVYRLPQPMGLVDNQSGDMLLPPAVAGLPGQFGLVVSRLLVLLDDGTGNRQWYLSEDDVFNDSARDDQLFFQDAGFDASGRFVVHLSRPLNGNEDFVIRTELLIPPVLTSTTGQSVMLPGKRVDGSSYSGPNAPRMFMDADRQTFSIPGEILFPVTLATRGEMIVQAVMTSIDDPATILYAENVSFFRPYQELASGGLNAVQARIQTYLIRLCNVFNTRLSSLDLNTDPTDTQVSTGVTAEALEQIVYSDYQYGRIGMEELNRIWQMARAFKQLQLQPDPSTQDFVDQVLSTAYIEPVGPDRVKIYVYLTFHGVYRRTDFARSAMTDGVWTVDRTHRILPSAGAQLAGTGTPNVYLDDVYQIPMEFSRYLVKNPSTDNWYLETEGEEHGVPSAEVTRPVIFDTQVDHADGADYLWVSTSLSPVAVLPDNSANPLDYARYALKLDVMKKSATGMSYPVPGYVDKALNFQGDGRYRRLLDEIFDADFPEYGDLDLHVKLIDLQDQASAVSTRVLHWYRPYQATEDVNALKTSLYDVFRQSVEAMKLYDFDTDVAPLLQDITEGPVPDSLRDRHALLHGYVAGLECSLAPQSDSFLEPIGPNKAILRLPYVRWTGVYSQDLPGGLFNSEGKMLLPPGFAGDPFDFRQPRMRCLVKVRIPNTVNPVRYRWIISAYRDEEFSTTPVLETAVRGQIIDAHFQPHPSPPDPARPREILLVGIANPLAGQVSLINRPRVAIRVFDESLTDPLVIKDYILAPMDPGMISALMLSGDVSWFYTLRKDLEDGLGGLFPPGFAYVNQGIEVEISFVFDADGAGPQPAGTFRWTLPYYFGNRMNPIEDAMIQRVSPTENDRLVSWGYRIPKHRAFADNGQIVEFVDLGPVTDPGVVNTMYVIMNPDQHPVFELIPGEPGYSDITQVIFKNQGGSAPDLPITDALTAAALPDMPNLSSGFAIRAVVPDGTTIDEDSRQPRPGFYAGQRVFYFDFDMDPTDADPSSVINVHPTGINHWYTLNTQTSGAVSDNAVFQFVPGDLDVNSASLYNPVVMVHNLLVPDGYVSGSVRTISGIESQVTATEFTDTPGGYRICPVVHVGAGVEIFNTFIESLNNQTVSGSQEPVNPLPITLGTWDFNIHGQGFGSSQVNPGMGLFFKPSSLNTLPPILVVNNADPSWSDLDIWFNETDLRRVSPVAGLNGEFIIATFRLDDLGVPTHVLPVSNPIPVTFITNSTEAGSVIQFIGDDSVPLPDDALYALNPDVIMPVRGTRFGAKRSIAGKALVFIPRPPVPEDPDFVAYPTVLLTDSEPFWSDQALYVPVDVLTFIPAGVAGRIAIYPFDSRAWMVLSDALPISNEVPVHIPLVELPPAVIEIVDGQPVDGAETDLTLAMSFAISGQSFGMQTVGVKTRDLVFQSLDGATFVILAGNNLDGWSDSGITDINIPPDAHGSGLIFIRDLPTSTTVSELVPVLFPDTP